MNCLIFVKDFKQQKNVLLEDFFNFKSDKSSDIPSHISKNENLTYRY